MGKQKISEQEIKTIVRLRETGHTLPEIKKIVPRGSGTIFKYIKNIAILPAYKEIWEAKRGGSKALSVRNWVEAQRKANALIPHINTKEKIIIAACLYWGEGTKGDFSLSNTDPNLIKAFITCLKEIGVTSKDLRITIRTYEDLDREKVTTHWAKVVGIPRKQILGINVLKGKKRGKLPYGMCRVRVTKGARYLKLFQSVMKAIIAQLSSSPCSLMDRTPHS